MNGMNQQDKIEVIKNEVSRIMHLHYCDNDIEGVIEAFAPQFSWFGAGEEQYVAGYEPAVEFFRRFKGEIPKCNIWGEEYDVIEPAQDIFICTGMMWIETDPCVQMYLKVHQRITFVFIWDEECPVCTHIHCSNPYMDMVEGEMFPDKIGRQSYEYVQERVRRLEEEMKQKNRQLDVIMACIPGGLKISKDDDKYSFAYVSEEAAALFGYTVDEFIEATGGTAVGSVYPPDLESTLKGCEEAFRDGGKEYAQKYRVRCKDGSLKWILDSGRKSLNDKGETLINSFYLDITKSEQDAREILRQKKMLNSIFDTVSCGILRLKRKNDVYELTAINPTAVYLLGVEEQEVFQYDWKDGTAQSLVEEDRYILTHSYDQLKKPGDSVDVEYRVLWPDGSIHWLRGTNMVISAEEDTQVIQRIFYDVTESKNLQEQLDREQEMYRLAMESSSNIMYEYTMENDTLITYKPKTDSEGKQSVVKIEIPECQKQMSENGIVHPADLQTVINNICKGRAEVIEARFGMLNHKQEREYMWHRVTGKVMIRGGKPWRVVGTIRNIHREKQTLSANMEELHMNQSALQAISGAYASIYFMDIETDRFYVVRLPEFDSGVRYVREGKFSRDMSCYIEESVADEDKAKMAAFMEAENLRQILHNVNDSTCIEYCEIRDGLRRWLRIDVHLVSKELGRNRNIIMAFRNVTEERQRELEHRQEEEKAKRALEEAYEAARRANFAKSDFLSKMSHDIRTPMNAVMGMLTIAENNMSDSEKLKECLAKIRMSSEHLLSLINEVLDMSKIESGNVGLNEEPFNIMDTISNAVEIIRQESDAKNQELIFSAGEIEHEEVKGDMVRVQQIVLNLLSNAVKYTSKGGHIQTEIKEILHSEGCVGGYQLTVQDDGIGMSEEFKEKIFRPFERAEDSRVSKVQGTGLGMSITQNLVHMMNGTIELESEINKGTRFIVTIYLKLSDIDKKQQAKELEKDIRIKGLFNILLVEDNDLNREIAKEFLEMEEIHVEEAENGKEALKRFCSAPQGYYNLILMDIQMPVMNGYDAARAIRGTGRSDADIPIIALTANAFVDDIHHAKQAGMNAHLAKPLDIMQMKQVLHEWLR